VGLAYVVCFVEAFWVTIGPAASPGPVGATVVTEGVRRGVRVGPLISTGHALTELALVGALALGMGRVLESPPLAAAVGILGGLYLLWMGGRMGWGVVRERPCLPRPSEGGEHEAGRSLIGLGIATTVSNPFWYVWWVSAGAWYVLTARQRGFLYLAAFYLGHVSADYAWNTLLASVVGSGRRWLTDAVYRALLLVCALFLVYTGLRFLWTGVGMVL
jgi:threonine/homoserine/homoserine lactone efflux protein